MWIIPKNLHTSLSAQVMEGLTLDSGELSEIYAQSLLARSKPSPVKTWSRRLKQATLTLLPFGRTLRPSHGKAFAAEWTSSVEASLVSHLVPQGDERETATPAICGPSLPTELDVWGTLPLFSWRTSKGSSVQSSKGTDGPTLRERPFCSMSSESWKGWVTTQRREYSARARSVRPISESECSSWVAAPSSARQGERLLVDCSERQSRNWPTPKALEVNESAEQWAKRRLKPGAKMMGPSLTVAVQLPTPPQEEQSSTLGSPQESRWATPTAGASAHDSSIVHSHLRRLKKGKQVSLAGQILIDMNSQANWATPTSRDCKGMYPQWSQESENKRTRNLLPDQAHGGTYRGKLNPRWVETLMGIPIGWTMPSCTSPVTIEQMNCGCLETELCQRPQSERLDSCGQTLEEALGPDIMRRFESLTDSLGIPKDDAEANMFALEEVLNNRDAHPWIDDE